MPGGGPGAGGWEPARHHADFSAGSPPDGDFTPPKFYDENDEEIIFNQGKTWICNIWQEYGEYVQYGRDDESLITPYMPSVTSSGA